MRHERVDGRLSSSRDGSELEAEIEMLRLRLDEAEQTLDAIRSGAVDSVVVEAADGLRVYALEGTANTYRVLIEAMSEGAATLTEDGVVLYCNNRLARMLDLPLQQVMGSRLLDRIPDRFRTELQSLILLSQTEECRGELALTDAGGCEVPTYFSLNTIAAEGRRVVCVVAVDLRPKRRTEERLASEMTRRVAAESSSHFAQLFMAVLGHDLRNPLSAILTGVQFLSRISKDETQLRLIGRMLSSGERMARMIEQLLDVTRIGLGGGLHLQRREVSLEEICQSVVDEVALLVGAPRIAFEHLGDTRGLFDPDRMSQVVSNLLGNAVHHGSPESPASLVVDGRGREIKLAIHNDGAIEQSMLPRLFEPFRGAMSSVADPSSPPARASAGLGLGLYITERIVHAHGGRVEVRSSEDSGTSFVVTLPRIEPPAS